MCKDTVYKKIEKFNIFFFSVQYWALLFYAEVTLWKKLYLRIQYRAASVGASSIGNDTTIHKARVITATALQRKGTRKNP
jgi:hypothetical protein